MRKVQKAKANLKKSSKYEAGPDLQESLPAWMSVIADAEQRVAELQRSIEWARAGRERLRAACHDSQPDQKTV